MSQPRKMLHCGGARLAGLRMIERLLFRRSVSPPGLPAVRGQINTFSSDKYFIGIIKLELQALGELYQTFRVQTI